MKYQNIYFYRMISACIGHDSFSLSSYEKICVVMVIDPLNVAVFINVAVFFMNAVAFLFAYTFLKAHQLK